MPSTHGLPGDHGKADPRAAPPSIAGPCTLQVTLDGVDGTFQFEWFAAGTTQTVAKATLGPAPTDAFGPGGIECRLFLPTWRDTPDDAPILNGCRAHTSSVRALVKRLRGWFPVADDGVSLGLRPRTATGSAQAGERVPVRSASSRSHWFWLESELAGYARGLARLSAEPDPAQRGRLVLGPLLDFHLKNLRAAPTDTRLNLRVELDIVRRDVRFSWTAPVGGPPIATASVRCTGRQLFLWTINTGGDPEEEHSGQQSDAIRAVLGRWLKRLPTNPETFVWGFLKAQPSSSVPQWEQQPALPPEVGVFEFIETNLLNLAMADRQARQRAADPLGYYSPAETEAYARRLARKEEKRAAEAARRQATIARFAADRAAAAAEAAAERAAAKKTAATSTRTASATSHAAPNSTSPSANPRAASTSASLSHSPSHSPASRSSPRPAPTPLPVPPVPIALRLPALTFQETAFPLADLRDFALRERAALWWVSNQSDDLLCLPHCRIRRLDHQVRTALRVLGPLRGRALLSDEVGLGKTVEAGLVLKELLTRGMVKRFLVLTLPSLVDQWAEELRDKFGIDTFTTNRPGARDDPARLWRDNSALVASLHTLKQPAHLAVAREVHWDLLVVDEAHHLRNRDSQAWQAVNALPRQFLLLLTATPVQNSLEELYNLVTLLMPGQLPTPREFRARFLDPARPRQPREPEELRRLLGQVMIRNTRANAGLDLPPRHAETAIFAPEPADAAFWQQWETEFRAALARLTPSLASLWGRLLLRAAGSSPAAWRSALAKFPEAATARAWREQAPLAGSWRRKCETLVPLARGPGGVVVFTEFLETQSALAEFLRAAGLPVFVINGATPAPERQPITEEFRAHGGALVLTPSGTEGRNLQFCRCLANFDLPWNPMEIEQRIGRLHRLGQEHPVRICNFVQAGTLQEHLLRILQEKLNLFELVVGETGLVLGERYGGDEFEEEIFRRWRESEGRVAESLAGLGDELAAARDRHAEVKRLDATLFAQDYESL